MDGGASPASRPGHGSLGAGATLSRGDPLPWGWQRGWLSARAEGASHLLPLHPRHDILGSGIDVLPRGTPSTPPRDANHG